MRPDVKQPAGAGPTVAPGRAARLLPIVGSLWAPAALFVYAIYQGWLGKFVALYVPYVLFIATFGFLVWVNISIIRASRGSSFDARRGRRVVAANMFVASVRFQVFDAWPYRLFRRGGPSGRTRAGGDRARSGVRGHQLGIALDPGSGPTPQALRGAAAGAGCPSLAIVDQPLLRMDRPLRFPDARSCWVI